MSRLIVLIPTLILSAGCAALTPAVPYQNAQTFHRSVHADIRTIAILTPSGPSTICIPQVPEDLICLEHRAGSTSQPRTGPSTLKFEAALKRVAPDHRTDVKNELVTKLRQTLNERGLQVSIQPVERTQPGAWTQYSMLGESADAYLDLRIVGGFASSVTPVVAPWLYVDAQLIRRGSLEVLYADKVLFGNVPDLVAPTGSASVAGSLIAALKIPSGPVVLPAPSEATFDKPEALFNDPVRAVDGLHEGISKVCALIAAQLTQ